MRCGGRGRGVKKTCRCRHVKKICQWHIFSVDLSGYAAVASFLGYAAHIEVRWAGSANPAHLSMESCGSAPRSAAGRKKAHSHTQPCEKEKRTAKAGRALTNTSRFGFGNGDSPGAAHLVSDLSRSFTRGHHSDLLAGTLTPFRRQSRKTGAPSCYSVFFYCTTCRGKLQEGICPAAVFFMCRGAEALPCPTVSAYFTTSWLAAEPKMSCHAASTLATSSCASFASSAVLSSGPCPRISSAT